MGKEDKSVDQERVELGLEDLPSGRNSVVILDSAKKFFFLPGYSPDLNHSVQLFLKSLN